MDTSTTESISRVIRPEILISTTYRGRNGSLRREGLKMECYRTDLRAAVRRARGGELDAFGFVVGRFREMTVGYAYSILTVR